MDFLEAHEVQVVEVSSAAFEFSAGEKVALEVINDREYELLSFPDLTYET